MLSRKGALLRIFVGESDHYEGKPLYEWILLKARDEGLAGATVLRGLAGFGANSLIHTSKVLRLSDDLPMIIECIDKWEKIHTFLSLIDEVIGEGVALIHEVDIHIYRSNV